MLCKSSLTASPLSCFAVIIFCLTIVACDVSVGFLNACYVGLGPVFFCTYEECKALINLSGSPQGHPRLDILATPYGVHVAHGHSTHAEAFTLLQSYRRTHPSSVLERAPARADAPVCVRAAALRCLTVRSARAGRRIRMRPGRPLCEKALREASAVQAAAGRSRRLRRR